MRKRDWRERKRKKNQMKRLEDKTINQGRRQDLHQSKSQTK